MTAKAILAELIQAMPDDCTAADVAYRVHVFAALEEGVDDDRARRTVSHEDVMRDLLQRWA